MKRLMFLLLFAATFEARPIAFTNVNVIPMTSDAVLTKQVVIVDDGRIVALGKGGRGRHPERRAAHRRRRRIPVGLTDLHGDKKRPDALRLFRANVALHPDSLTARQSLADVLAGH
jgi:hypothetical protein